jgi:cyclin-dependent kinase-like
MLDKASQNQPNQVQMSDIRLAASFNLEKEKRRKIAEMIQFRVLNERDIEDASKLESSCYPESEAASAEQVAYRLRNCVNLCIGAYSDSQLIGLLMATATMQDKITLKSMKIHEAEGKCVCIHSVCIAESLRGQGLALKMLQYYLNHITEMGYSRASLITHDYLIPLYQKAGFDCDGVSEIVHGPDSWYLMNKLLQ